MSQHHDAINWRSTGSKTARARIVPMLPSPCIEGCGRLVYADQPWDAAHIVPLSLGGDPGRYGPAHRSCNRRNGGRMGAAVTNTNLPTSKRLPQW